MIGNDTRLSCGCQCIGTKKKTLAHMSDADLSQSYWARMAQLAPIPSPRLPDDLFSSPAHPLPPSTECTLRMAYYLTTLLTRVVQVTYDEIDRLLTSSPTDSCTNCTYKTHWHPHQLTASASLPNVLPSTHTHGM